MVISAQIMTAAEYLAYDSGTDERFELENGILIKMPPESRLNDAIASFLFALFLEQGISYSQLTTKAEIAVTGARATFRLPDLMVYSEELVVALEGATRTTVTLDMPPPQLVVEVVSPNQAERDYRFKRSEYAAREIPEYWVVDPIEQRVTIFEWVQGLYEPREFRGEARLVSPTLPDLSVTANQVLRPE